MKKLIFLFTILIFCSNLIYSQVSYEYSYDNSGNRTQRLIIRMDTNDTFRADLLSTYEIKDIRNQIAIFPNPTKGVINLQFPQSLENKTINYCILSFKGNILLTGKFLAFEDKVDISKFSNGTYILILIVEDKQYEYKIIKI